MEGDKDAVGAKAGHDGAAPGREGGAEEEEGRRATRAPEQE